MRHDAQNVPKIYAHRGASFDFPEHTREAYLQAIAQGADGLECDVRLTKDGVAVLWHDPDMSRITHSRFLGTIAELTYSEVVNQYSETMTLDEILELAISNGVDVAIELKHPVPSGYDVENEVARLLNARAQEINHSGLKVSIMSFSWLALEFFHRLDLSIEANTVMLLGPRSPRFYRRFTSAKSYGPHIGLLKQEFKKFRGMQETGKELYVWTVDDSADLEFCSKVPVDVIVTNKPGHARKVLGYP